MTDQQIVAIADEQIDWLAEKLLRSREAGRLAFLSILLSLRDQIAAERAKKGSRT